MIIWCQYNIAAPVNEDDCEEDEEEDEYGAKKKEDLDSDDPVERKYLDFVFIGNMLKYTTRPLNKIFQEII